MSTQGLGLTPPILREPTSLPGRWRWCDRPWLCDARKSKRASHIDPPASSYAHHAEGLSLPRREPWTRQGRSGELDHWPGIREQPGSFATELSRQQVGPCPLCSDSDPILQPGEMSRMGWTGRAPAPEPLRG
jgi:hypothetical protein